MNTKVMALVIIVSAVGLFSGFIMLQTLTNNSSNTLPEENLELSNQHVWFNQSGWAEAAIVVVNVGERDTVLRKITVRSIESRWSDIYYWRTNTGPISNELTQTSNELLGSSFSIFVDGQQRSFQQATSELALASGWTIVLYLTNPGNITLQEDIANIEAVTIAVFSENKLYYKSASIDLTWTFMKTEELKVQGHTWGTGQITLSVKNTGTSLLTVSEARVNDVAQDITDVTLQPGDVVNVVITGTFVSGTKYEFAVVTATGNRYPYVATAP